MKVKSNYIIKMNGKIGTVSALTHLTKDAEVIKRSVIIFADEGKMLRNKLTEKEAKSFKLSEMDSVENYEEI